MKKRKSKKVEFTKQDLFVGNIKFANPVYVSGVNHEYFVGKHADASEKQIIVREEEILQQNYGITKYGDKNSPIIKENALLLRVYKTKEESFYLDLDKINLLKYFEIKRNTKNFQSLPLENDTIIYNKIIKQCLYVDEDSVLPFDIDTASTNYSLIKEAKRYKK